MTTDIEKQFFDTFGIVAKLDCKRCGAMNFALGKCAEVKCEKTYPQITDRILLELICILNPFCYPSGQNIQHLKESVLDWCITFKDDIEQQVQALFKEDI